MGLPIFWQGGAAANTISGGITFGAPSLAGTAKSTFRVSGGVTFVKPSLAGQAQAIYWLSGGLGIAAPSLAGQVGVPAVGLSGGIAFGVATLDGVLKEVYPILGGVSIGLPEILGALTITAPPASGATRRSRTAGRGGRAMWLDNPMTPPSVGLGGSASVSAPRLAGALDSNDDELALVALLL